MRKADYQSLASILRETIRTYGPMPGASAYTRCEEVARVVVRFAEVASVDKVAFLGACGLPFVRPDGQRIPLE